MSITALVIDDSASARQIIRYHLRQIGCLVVGEAASAAEGLKLFRELRPKPSIVTLDLMMPVEDDVDSLTLVRKIKQEAPGTAVIVVSVIPSEKIRQSFIDAGVFAYLNKPFNNYALASISMKLTRAFPELIAVRGSDR